MSRLTENDSSITTPKTSCPPHIDSGHAEDGNSQGLGFHTRNSRGHRGSESLCGSACVAAIFSDLDVHFRTVLYRTLLGRLFEVTHPTISGPTKVLGSYMFLDYSSHRSTPNSGVRAFNFKQVDMPANLIQLYAGIPEAP